MNFLKRLGVLVYMLLMAATGALFILAALGVISPEAWASFFSTICASEDLQVLLSAIGSVFVLIGVVSFVMFSKNIRGRVLTFQNPEGEVTVSVAAIEDYIRKVGHEIPGVKDLKSRISVDKSGINIGTALSLMAGSNISEVMERVQMTIKSNVRTMLGVETPINVKLHISRFAGELPPETAPGVEEPLSHIPYRE